MLAIVPIVGATLRTPVRPPVGSDVIDSTPVHDGLERRAVALGGDGRPADRVERGPRLHRPVVEDGQGLSVDGDRPFAPRSGSAGPGRRTPCRRPRRSPRPAPDPSGSAPPARSRPCCTPAARRAPWRGLPRGRWRGPCPPRPRPGTPAWPRRLPRSRRRTPARPPGSWATTGGRARSAAGRPRRPGSGPGGPDGPATHGGGSDHGHTITTRPARSGCRTGPRRRPAARAGRRARATPARRRRPHARRCQARRPATTRRRRDPCGPARRWARAASAPDHGGAGSRAWSSSRWVASAADRRAR